MPIILYFSAACRLNFPCGVVGTALGTRGPFCDCTQTVWNDPHIGGEHGFVEFVRVVDQEATLLVAPEKGHHKTTKLEAWRPMLEDIAGSNAWEWTVHSTAWAAEWTAGGLGAIPVRNCWCI